MKNKNHILFALIGFLLIGSFVALGAASRSAEKEIKNGTCCKQKQNGCPDNNPGAAPGDMILDNFSSQFMSIISFGR